MKLKCIDIKKTGTAFTIGKIYEVDDKSFIRDDKYDYIKTLDSCRDVKSTIKYLDSWYEFKIISEDSKKGEDETMNDKLNLGIERVSFNKNTTVIQWENKDKTVVTATENDQFNPQFGFLMAYFQKQSGMSKTEVGKFMKEIKEECEKQNKSFDKKLVRLENKKNKNKETE